MDISTVFIGWRDRDAKESVFNFVTKVEKRGSQYEKFLVLAYGDGGTTTIMLGEVAYYSVLPIAIAADVGF